MGLPEFFRLMLRGWRIIVLAVVLTAGSAGLFVSRQAPEYRATTTVELVPRSALAENHVVDVYNLLDKRNISNTIARKAEGSSMAEVVANKLLVDVSVIRAADISAIVLPDSNIIEIQASNSNRDLAAAICNAVAAEMLGQTPDKILQIEALDQAVPPSSPIAPQPARVITLGLISGLVIGIAFILLENALRNPATPSGVGGSGGGRREPPVLAGSPGAPVTSSTLGGEGGSTMKTAALGALETARVVVARKRTGRR